MTTTIIPILTALAIAIPILAIWAYFQERVLKKKPKEGNDKSI